MYTILYIDANFYKLNKSFFLKYVFFFNQLPKACRNGKSLTLNCQCVRNSYQTDTHHMMENNTQNHILDKLRIDDAQWRSPMSGRMRQYAIVHFMYGQTENVHLAVRCQWLIFFSHTTKYSSSIK